MHTYKMRKSLSLLFWIVFTCTVFDAGAQQSGKPFGIKICGAEFGTNHFPGQYGVDFIYPDSLELDYFFRRASG